MDKNFVYDLKENIEELKSSGVTLDRLSEELSYRENSGDNRWDDDLYVYSTDELGFMEVSWDTL